MIAAIGWLVVALFVLVFALSGWSLLKGKANWHDFWGPAAGAYLAVWHWWLVPRRLRKLYSQQKGVQEPVSVELRPEGLFFASIRGSGLLPWSHVHKWRESAHLLLVYHSDALYNVLPKRDLSSSEVQQIRQGLLEHVGPANNSFKPTPLRGAA